MKNKSAISWGVKIILFVLLISVLMFPISPSVSLDSEGKPLDEIEKRDHNQIILKIEPELSPDTISGIAAAALTTLSVPAQVEIY